MERYANLKRGQIAARRLQLPDRPRGGWGGMASGSLKRRALNEARSYLRAVGKALRGLGDWRPYIGRGFGKTGTSINPGGQAVSGEATAVFLLSGSAFSVRIEVSPDVVNRRGIMWRKAPGDDPIGGHFGPGMQNRWDDKNTSAEDLARKIHKAIGD